MAMSKFWQETWDRLDKIEKELKGLKGGGQSPKWETLITKEDLTSINGVGGALADKILDKLYEAAAK